MAPEVALKEAYNESVDVYSFGIMVWQMARDRLPFKGMTKDEFVDQIILGGARPKLDRTWPPEFSGLLTSCWHADPTVRPAFEQIVAELSRLIDDLDQKSWIKSAKARVSPGKQLHSSWF
jgi:serine/threonine protein kinase